MAYLCVNKNPLTYKSIYLNRNKYAIFMEFVTFEYSYVFRQMIFFFFFLIRSDPVLCAHCAFYMNFVPLKLNPYSATAWK